MSTESINVFLSSRFAQLRDYRKNISLQMAERLADAFPLQLIDMDDGRAREQPPRDACLAAVRSSEFMLLLVDDSYGSPAPNAEFSFTHLEYLEAVRQGSQTKVLCYFISDHPIGSPGEAELDPRLQKWRAQLTDKHTPVRFGRDVDISAVCTQIVRDLHSHLVQWLQRNGAAGSSQSEEDDALEIDERPIAEDLLDQLERRRREDASQASIAASPPSLPNGPNAVHAKEQEALAEYAQQVGELEVAIDHLSTCLDLVPLQPRLQYRLALLFLAQPSRQRLQRAAALLEQASRVFIAIEKPYWAAASLTALARVRITLDPSDAASAILASEKAVSMRKDFRIAHYEHGRLLAALGRSKEALEVLDQLGRLSPRHYAIADRDPAFDTCRDEIQTRLRALRQRMSDAAGKINALSSAIAEMPVHVEGTDVASHCEMAPNLPTDFPDLSAVKMVQVLRSYNAGFARWIRQLGALVAEDMARARRDVEHYLREMEEKSSAAAKWAGGLAAGAVAVLWVGIVPAILPGLASVAALGYWRMCRNRIARAMTFRSQNDDSVTAPRPLDMDAGPLGKEKRLKAKQSLWIKILQDWEASVDKLPMEALPFRGIQSAHRAGRGEVVRLRLAGLPANENSNLLFEEDGYGGDTPEVPRLFVVRGKEGEIVRVSRSALADG